MAKHEEVSKFMKMIECLAISRSKTTKKILGQM